MPPELEPLDALYDAPAADEETCEITLPPQLARLYGQLTLPRYKRPYVIANFVSTLDGVVALEPASAAGGQISGRNRHDWMVMGVLRAVADAVIVAAGTVTSAPRHLWTPAYVFAPLADDYAALRQSLGKPPAPLAVVVSARGSVSPAHPVFQSGVAPVLLLTSQEGAARMASDGPLPDYVRVVTGDGTKWTPAAIINATRAELVRLDAGLGHDGPATGPAAGMEPLLLLEGGPRLMGAFYGADALDEQFLTLAPQVAGRDASSTRPAFIEGQQLAPDHPTWGTLVSAKRAGSHIFLRYRFPVG